MTSKTSNTEAASPEHLSTYPHTDQYQRGWSNGSPAVETGVFGAGFTSPSPNTHSNHLNMGAHPNFNNISDPYSTRGVNETFRTNGINHQQRYGNGFPPHQPTTFFGNQYAITDFVSANGVLYHSSTKAVELTKDFLEKELALYETFINELNTTTDTANYHVDTKTLLVNKRAMVDNFMRNYWREKFLTNEDGLTFFLRNNHNTLNEEFKEALVTSLNTFKNKDILNMDLVVGGRLVTISKNQSGSFDVCIR